MEQIVLGITLGLSYNNFSREDQLAITEWELSDIEGRYEIWNAQILQKKKILEADVEELKKKYNFTSSHDVSFTDCQKLYYEGNNILRRLEIFRNEVSESPLNDFFSRHNLQHLLTNEGN
ncbi:hypothetical protein K7432_011274 [Basidiobolus ranarum]|uniref:Uncharacterized protein n=1 Tax=Basidiobolus ranarum TaxID=34480 RepID=A0ABR2WMJ2_9FUNG